MSRFYARYRGYGALPSFDLPAGAPPMAVNLVNAFLNQVPPGSPGGMNGRQLIARARELQAQYGDLMVLPEGAEIVAAATALEGSLAQAWGEIVSFSTQLATLLLHDPNTELAALGPMPGENYLNNSLRDNWDKARKAIEARSALWVSQVDSITAKLKNSIGTSFGSKLMNYVANVSSAADRIRNLQHAITEQKTAAANNDSIGLQIATKKAEVEKKALDKAAAKLSGPSPMTIALIALPLLGVAAYALSRRKSSPSVAGYRRRSRR